MKKSLLLLCLLAACTAVQAQQFSTMWKPVTGTLAAKTEQQLHPAAFRAYQASEQVLEDFLSKVGTDPAAPQQIDLPAPDGTMQPFLIWQTPVMAGTLAARYPGIRTFTASAAGNRRITAKLDYTPFGFHAMVFDGNNTWLVDPYGGVADGNYISYYKRDYPRPAVNAMTCTLKDPAGNDQQEQRISMTDSGLPQLANKVNGTTVRHYRLALACTGEYAVAVAGANPTKAAVLAKMVVSVNRVNGVYERELAYTMELIGNTDDVIYLDGNTDPFTNNDGNTMLAQNQATMASVIGLGNFDIGHVFSTGGGGIASKGSVCQLAVKAQGVTGRPNPVGDAFDIDFVAHEMGHQFGADHTFNYNGSGGSCAGNAVSNYAYEPGSGSTLMAYAGICGGANDYQAHSDAYFHSASLEQITTYISGTSCAVTSTSPNANASLPAYTATYNIPFLTPFELTGPNATDANADTLSYTWEQRDRGDFGKTLANTRLRGPLFRPYPPTSSTTRIFPRIETILNRVTATNGEKLPDTARTMAFRFTERDIYQGFGCWNIPVDSIRLNVIYTGIPFAVTSPSGVVTWQAGATQTVTWNVASTTNTPISCSTVDIYLSTDGGYTFPYTLASGTPNDGIEDITVPAVNTDKMRIKVKGSGNVFFAISGFNSNITGNVGIRPVQELAVTVAPVPATGTVYIRAAGNTELVQARIVNALGQLIWQGTMQQSLAIPVHSWAKGIYHLQLAGKAGNPLANKRIVVE